MPIKRKRSMSSFDVAAVASEASRLLVGARLVNVYDMPGGGLLLRLRGSGGDYRVAAVPGVRVHLTRFDVGGKGMPSPIVMGIRKHIRGGRVVSVEQLGFDRILVLGVDSGSGVYRLVVEVLPRGVYALLSPEGRILQLSEAREMRDRVLRRGAPYTPPPGGPRRPSQLGVEELRELLGGGGEAARTLARGLGYPGEVVEEALLRIGVKPSEPAEKVPPEQLLEELRRIEAEALEARGYIVYGGEGLAVTVVPFNPRALAEEYGYTVKSFGSVSDALDAYFVEELRRVEEAEAVKGIEAERKRLEASIEKARRNLEKLRERLERLDKMITVLGENMHIVYEAVECARRLRDRSGWEAVPGNCPGVVDVEPSRGRILLSIGGELVPVDIRVEPSQLLVELSRERGEVEAKIRRGLQALRELEERLRGLRAEAEAAARRARALVRRREWYEKYHWLVTSHGYLAIGGRDASQNESVVKRYLNERRIFMHADIHGAPAVVVFAEGEQPPEQDLREAALLTAAYSRAWKEGLGSVDVYWVWGSQVSKTPPPGEYLARGAFMVYGKRNYIRNVELRLGLGLASEDGSPLVIVGPPELVKKRSLVYAVLAPGDEDPSRLAARLKKLLRGKLPEEQRPLADALSAEEIRLRLPGRSRVLRVARGDASEPPRPVKRLPGAEEG